jgi:hypothetical protein
MSQPALTRTICRDIGTGVAVFKVPARQSPCLRRMARLTVGSSNATPPC